MFINNSLILQDTSICIREKGSHVQTHWIIEMKFMWSSVILYPKASKYFNSLTVFSLNSKSIVSLQL